MVKLVEYTIPISGIYKINIQHSSKEVLATYRNALKYASIYPAGNFHTQTMEVMSLCVHDVFSVQAYSMPTSIVKVYIERVSNSAGDVREDIIWTPDKKGTLYYGW